MNDVLKHYKSLPRAELQRQLRAITGIKELHLWEYVGLNWMFEAVKADTVLADHLGIGVGDVVGYRVVAGHVMGGALGDLMNVTAHDAPDPDPFR